MSTHPFKEQGHGGKCFDESFTVDDPGISFIEFRFIGPRDMIGNICATLPDPQIDDKDRWNGNTLPIFSGPGR